jgi:hypothetical protein
MDDSSTPTILVRWFRIEIESKLMLTFKSAQFCTSNLSWFFILIRSWYLHTILDWKKLWFFSDHTSTFYLQLLTITQLLHNWFQQVLVHSSSFIKQFHFELQRNLQFIPHNFYSLFTLLSSWLSLDFHWFSLSSVSKTKNKIWLQNKKLLSLPAKG